MLNWLFPLRRVRIVGKSINSGFVGYDYTLQDVETSRRYVLKCYNKGYGQIGDEFTVRDYWFWLE